MSALDLVKELKSAAEAEVEKFSALEEAISSEQADLQAKLDEVKNAPVPPPVAADADDQEKIDAAVKPFQDRIAALEAQLAEPDATPFDESDIAEAVVKAVDKAKEELKAELDAAADDHDAKEEAIGDAMEALVEQVRALTAKKSAPPKDGAAPEAQEPAV